ncbi:hypothetical protein ACFQ1I_07955 [Kitasatospora arboriphila]
MALHGTSVAELADQVLRPHRSHGAARPAGSRRGRQLPRHRPPRPRSRPGPRGSTRPVLADIARRITAALGAVGLAGRDSSPVG